MPPKDRMTRLADPLAADPPAEKPQMTAAAAKVLPPPVAPPVDPAIAKPPRKPRSDKGKPHRKPGQSVSPAPAKTSAPPVPAPPAIAETLKVPFRSRRG